MEVIEEGDELEEISWPPESLSPAQGVPEYGPETRGGSSGSGLSRAERKRRHGLGGGASEGGGAIIPPVGAEPVAVEADTGSGDSYEAVPAGPLLGEQEVEALPPPAPSGGKKRGLAMGAP